MAGDEPLMFKPEAELSALEKEHLAFMQHGILAWAMIFVALAKPQDHVVLDEAFLDYKDFFTWHLSCYRKLGLTLSPNIHFVKTEDIYAKAFALRQDDTLISTVCFSYRLHEHLPLTQQLIQSQSVNSKTELAAAAEKFAFKVPATHEIFADKITSSFLKKNFGFPHRKIVVKTNGLGGGFNVKITDQMSELKDFLKNYPSTQKFIVQEFVGGPQTHEYIADFVIDRENIELLNVRLKLTVANQWIGNVYSPELRLNSAQIQNLTRCVKGVRNTGYFAEPALPFGIDFLQNKHEQSILEINGRWTGGMPVYLFLEKLGLSNRLVYSHVDEVKISEVVKYKKFIEKNMNPAAKGRSFTILPLSFGPLPGSENLQVWILVLDDYSAFVKAKNTALGKKALPLSTLVHKASRAYSIPLKP